MQARSEGKFKSDYKLKDIYKLYKEENFEGLQVEYSLYSKVLKDFNKLLVEHIIEDPEGIKLPLNLGHIRVRKSKVDLTKSLIPDWKATNELWDRNEKAKADKKLVYHLNEHREGYKYKILWDKSRAKVKNKTFYFFIPTRNFKRTLAKTLKTNLKIDYYL